MKLAGAMTTSGVVAALAACSAGPSPPPAQLEAIETRRIDAPADATFRAAAGVMLDRGMMIKLSDRGAGLVGASSWTPFPETHAHHHPNSVDAPTEVMAWIRPDGAGQSILRVQFTQGGNPTRDAVEVSRFAEDVGKRTLMRPAPEHPVKRALLLIAACAAAPGCVTRSPMLAMTTTQQDTLQTRDLDAPPDRAFAAASNAIVNAGYTIGVTDGEGGLISAIRREDPSVAEHTAAFLLSALLTMGHGATGAPPDYYGVCVQVLPRPGNLSSVRICLYGHGNLKEEEAIIDDLWIQMQRDVLARSP